MNIVRKIEIENIYDFKTYSDWQSLYMDMSNGRLIPDTEIWSGDNLQLKINSMGCKGEEVENGIPVVAFFGDSATFGASFSIDSWPHHLGIRGCQSLNAAVEGYNMESAFNRYMEISGKINLAGVVVYSGWHNIIYGESTEEYWRSMLNRFAGDHVLAICTLATCLTDECKKTGIESLLCTDSPRSEYANYFEYNIESLNKKYFNFWANMEPSIENVQNVVDGVQRYNNFLKEYCSDTGHILIDLHSALLPSQYERIPDDFYDVCHLRPAAYEKTGKYTGKIIERQLKDFLRDRQDKYFIDAVNPLSNPQRFAGVGTSINNDRCVESGEDDLRKNIYPLW